ncbi:PIN domain-containing protein [Paenibacillus sp. J2TS4]|uniref:PIN domain-containing protein n=1 Tax=Paenibacillus sp. J2TS4 TaxID=2807194 RepID=UPI001B1D8585|nr:PIN domain-containing protein [Paenibacillus sp. J2TS4]GIP35966.1 hypothetical protein J2TS4_51760 [Paenibacillus sp. J2TS4]
MIKTRRTINLGKLKERNMPMELQDTLSIGVIIDTCDWISLAEGNGELLSLLENLVATDNIELVLPEQILDEWKSNKEESIKTATDKQLRDINNIHKSFQSLADRVKRNEQDTNLIKILDDVYASLVTVKESLANNHAKEEPGKQERINRIESLFYHANTKIITLEDTKNVKSKAIELSLQGKAPFHKKQKSMGDALIFLSALEYADENFFRKIYFISNNTEDFSLNGALHPDLQTLIKPYIDLTYWKSLPEAMNKMKEWSDDVAKFLAEEDARWKEEAREQREWEPLVSLHECDFCYRKNVMGYYLYHHDIPVLSICKKCDVKRLS